MAGITSSSGATDIISPGKSNIKILVVGKTGVGKSALINALVGYEVSPESAMEAGTYKVEEIQTEMHGGVKVTFYDSPGLHDAKGKEREYLQQIIDKCQDLDLILFCTKLTDTRVTEEDCDTICEFTRALGEDFWKNCVFVLTFANNVRPKTNIKDPEMKKKALRQKIALMSKKLREILRSKAQLPTQVVKDIPFVPAGYYTPEHQHLPDGTHWFSCFWLACFTRIRDVGKPAVIKGCLDMFEIEKEKKKDLPPQYQPQYPYPMPVLSHPAGPPPAYSDPNYTSLMRPSNRRAIPMGIHLPDLAAYEMIYDSIGYLVRGMGLPGKIISGVMGIGKDVLKHFLEENEEN